MCQNDESSSHSLIWAKILIQLLINMGSSTTAKEILRGTCRRLVYGCKYVVPNMINEGTS